MLPDEIDDVKIFNTTPNDLDIIFWLFEQAMELQGKNDYKVWEGIDKGALQKDIDEGTRLGVTGTPAFFINGRPLTGAQPVEAFARIIDEELARATASR